MSKRTILTWWIGGLAALVPAAVLLPSSGVALLAHLDQVQHGPGYHLLDDRYAVAMLILLAIGVVFAVAWLVAALVAWVGAVLNARQLGPRPGAVHRGAGRRPRGPRDDPAARSGHGDALRADDRVPGRRPGRNRTRSVADDARKADRSRVGGPRLHRRRGRRARRPRGVRLDRPRSAAHDATWPALAVVSVGIAGIAVGAIVVSAASWGALFNAHTLAGPDPSTECCGPGPRRWWSCRCSAWAPSSSP